MALGVAALLGIALWSLAEYGLHRFVFHEGVLGRAASHEHREHHRNPDYFAPGWQKALAAVFVTGLVGPAVALGFGLPVAAVFTAAFVAAYLAYEVLHRTVHTRPPRGAYGRWRRRNHLAHHFTDPRRAHGVTSPVWDHVFGTALPRHRVRVPAKLATRWMLDDRGGLRPELRDDYELVDPRASRPRQSSPAAA